MTKMISSFDAARLAELHHSVMVMIDTRSGFRVNVMTTPRKLLEEYLALSNKLGLYLFNEHWLAHACLVVEEIEAKRAEAAAALRRVA